MLSSPHETDPLAALAAAALLLALTGCASGGPPKPPKHIFETTYKDPDARPMRVRGAKWSRR